METQTPDQKLIRLPIVLLEHDNEPHDAATIQGEFIAELPKNLPEGSKISVSLWLDNDGCFKASAELHNSGGLTLQVEREITFSPVLNPSTSLLRATNSVNLENSTDTYEPSDK